MSTPIPGPLRERFFKLLDMKRDDSLEDDNEWFALLCKEAVIFMKKHGLTKNWMTSTDAVHQYLKHKGATITTTVTIKEDEE
jgi:hypothetical protein